MKQYLIELGGSNWPTVNETMGDITQYGFTNYRTN